MNNVNYIHNIIAAKNAGLILPIIMLIMFFFLAFACVGIMHYMKYTSISVTDESLIIKSIFYGKTIPLQKINTRGLRKLNLYSDWEYNVKTRANGIGLPNYFAGWMRLNNGAKALVFLTDRTSVALIPTDEYDILFSTDDYEGIKESLSKRR